MANASTTKPGTGADNSAARAKRVIAQATALRNALRELGPMPPSPLRDRLSDTLNELGLAAVAVLSGPKKPRTSGRRKPSVIDGWIGCG